MNTGNQQGATQQIQIRVGENALDLVDVFFGESESLHRFQRMLDVQNQPQLTHRYRSVMECERQSCGIRVDFNQIGQARTQKVVLQDWQNFVLFCCSARGKKIKLEVSSKIAYR